MSGLKDILELLGIAGEQNLTEKQTAELFMKEGFDELEAYSTAHIAFGGSDVIEIEDEDDEDVEDES